MLLKTKFFAPPLRSNAVARQRLLEQLAEPLPGQLTLIHAPAGYGKTTLALQWLTQLKTPKAWLSLDAQDNDPLRFWRYVSGALADPVRRPKSMVQADSDPESWVVFLLNHWTLQNPVLPTVLVLDDFHVIQDAALLEQVSWFLDRLPPSLHVLITSRTLPGLHIPLRRVRDTVNEIRADALCFGRTESQLFFQKTLHLAITPKTLDTLQAKTEGWAAALQLAGLSLKQQPTHAPGWLERETASVLIDYLAEEVLANLAPDLQQFLLRTALLRRFSLPLCCHLNPATSEDQIRLFLTSLRDDNLFLIPLDERGHWFRFHDLFRENLLNIARQQWPEELASHYRSAADWFVAEQDKEEAIHCLLCGESWHSAAELIEELGVTRMLAGQNESLNWWLSRIPAEIQMQRPKLALIKAWSLFCTERVIEAEPFLDQADRLLAPELPENRALRTQISIFRSQLARVRGDEPKAHYWSEQARLLATEAEGELNTVARFALGMELYQDGNHRAAQHVLEQALVASRAERNHFCVLTSSDMLAHVLFQQGFPKQALNCLDDARQWLLQQGFDMDYISRWQNILYVYFLRELNQLEQISDYMQPLLDYREQGAEAAHGALITVTQALLLAAQAQWPQALQMLGPADTVLEQDRSHWSAMGPSAGLLRTLLQLQSGQQAHALRWARDREALLLRQRNFRYEEDRILLARCLALQSRQPEALALLDEIEADTAAGGRLINQVRARIARALVLASLPDSEASVECLHQALQLSEPAGYRRVYLDESNALAPLFAQLAKRGMLGWWEAYASEPAPRAALPGLIEALTSRELEVLDMIASGHRNQAIADTLHIAITTTKAHIRNIYEKMAVNSRTQAVARARELGLLK